MHSTTAAPWRTAPIDQRRLLRAYAMYRVHGAVNLGPHVVIVYGGAERHVVDLADDTDQLCDCGDHTFRECLCAHALAGLIFVADERVVLALGHAMRDAWLSQAPRVPA